MNYNKHFLIYIKKLASSLIYLNIVLLTSCGGNYTEQVSKVVGKTKFLAPSSNNDMAQGFETITLNSQGILQIKLLEKIYAPEYEAPIIQSKKVEGTKANPVGTLFATFFTLGFYPIIETKGAIELTTGLKNEKLLNEQPDFSQQTRTGKYAWLTRPLKTAHLIVSGLSNSIPVQYETYDKDSFNFDITDALYEWTVKYNSNPQINIECHDCINNNSKESLPTKKILYFSAPEIWKLEANYRNNNDVIWLANKNINNFSIFSEPRTGLRTDNSWKNILAEINAKSNIQLKEQLNLPSELIKARNILIKSKPATEINISRDEFESSIEFNQRIKKLEAYQNQKTLEYNQQVDDLQRQISNFQNKAPTQLSKSQFQNIINTTILKMAGDPVIRNVKYDADLKRLVIQVSGMSQVNQTDLISLVSTNEIFATDAKKIKENAKNTRVYLNFDLMDNKIIPKNGHIYDGQKILPFQVIDEIVIPELHTAKIVIDKKSNSLENLKVNPELNKVLPNINLSADPDIALLRKRLDRLRAELVQKQQISDKNIINNEIKNLELKLKIINEGSFNDDLQDIISNSTNTTVNNNITAIVIGISDYLELPKVVFADRSADAFALALQKQFGIPEKNIVLIINEQATGYRLLERIRKAAERSLEGQKLIFYFAGHGAPSRDGKTPILIPFDASGNIIDEQAFRLHEIYKILLQSQAKQILIILDSCFSGLTDQNEMIFKDIAPIMPKVSDVGYLNDKRLIILAGSGPSDFAHAFRNKGHRLFTYHLIKEITNSKGLYKNRYPSLIDSVTSDSLRLIPSFEQKPMWIGGEFNLISAQ